MSFIYKHIEKKYLNIETISFKKETYDSLFLSLESSTFFCLLASDTSLELLSLDSSAELSSLSEPDSDDSSDDEFSNEDEDEDDVAFRAFSLFLT